MSSVWRYELNRSMSTSRSGRCLAVPEKRLSIGAGLATYEAARHFADARAVTRLSAYVHHGQLSARLLAAETARAGGARLSKTLTRRLIWRDLAYWQLALWPAMAREPMRPHYAAQVRVLPVPATPAYSSSSLSTHSSSLGASAKSCMHREARVELRAFRFPWLPMQHMHVSMLGAQEVCNRVTHTSESMLGARRNGATE